MLFSNGVSRLRKPVNRCGMAVFLLVSLAFLQPLPARAQLAGVEQVQDESLLLAIRLAARAGEYELAETRLAALKKPHLTAKGTAALAVEYALAEDLETAGLLFESAQKQASNRDIRRRNRVSSLLYIAKLMRESEEFADDATTVLDQASGLLGGLTGFDLDISLIELTRVSFLMNRDPQEAQEILSLIREPSLRKKMLALYGFEKSPSDN